MVAAFDSSNYDLPTEMPQEHEGIVMKHGDLVNCEHARLVYNYAILISTG